MQKVTNEDNNIDSPTIDNTENLDDEMSPIYELKRIDNMQSGNLISTAILKTLYLHRNESPMTCNKKIMSSPDGLIMSTGCGTNCPFFKIVPHKIKKIPSVENNNEMVDSGYAAAVLWCEASPISFKLMNLKITAKKENN